MKVQNCIVLTSDRSLVELSPEESANGSFTGNIVWPVSKIHELPQSYIDRILYGYPLANDSERGCADD